MPVASKPPAQPAVVYPATRIVRTPLLGARTLMRDSLSRNSAFLLMATVELAAGGFLFWQLAAHLFGAADVGRASALISGSVLIANIALLGMHNSVIRYLPAWADRADTANTAVTVVALAALIGSLGFVLGSTWFAPQLSLYLRQPLAAIVFVLSTIAFAVSLLTDSVFVALRRSGLVLGRNTITVVLRLVVPLACVGLGTLGVFASYQGAVTVGLLLYLVVMRRTVGAGTRLRIRWKRLAAMWRYSVGNYLATMILVLPTVTMPILITERVDAVQAAYYYIASLLAGVLAFVPQATSRSFFAEAAEDPTHVRSLLGHAVRLTLAAEVPILLVLVAGGRFALALFGREYTAAYPLLVLLATSQALASIGFVGSTLLMVTGRLRLMCVLSAVASATTLVGAYLLMRRGIVWVGWSMVAGEALLSAAYLVLVAATLRGHGDRDRSGRILSVPRLPYRVAVGVARTGATWWRRRIRRRAVDATDLITRRSTLVVAPHPDDETLGAGATIARCAAAGTPVAIAVATDGRHSTRSSMLPPDQLAAVRTNELLAACEALGVARQNVVMFGFEDGTLRANHDRLVRRLRALLRDRTPDQVLIPCEQDVHPDHIAVHHALRQAVRDLELDCTIIAYPIWAWARGPWFRQTPLRTRVYLLRWAGRQLIGRNRPASVSTAGHLTAKQAALRAHASQTTNLTDEPGWQYLQPDFCALFLRDEEIFMPVVEG